MRLIIVLVLCIVCSRPVYSQRSGARIEVGYHKTIETIMVLRAISDSDYFFSKVPDTSKRRPLLHEARQYFLKFKHHDAVSATQQMLKMTRDIGGTLFQGVLYAKELPGRGYIQQPAGFWQTHTAELEQYLQILHQFYHDAGVEKFFIKYAGFYEGAAREAGRYMNPDLIPAMEEYFGKTNKAYHLYILPLSPYGWGFSATIVTNGEETQYAMVSPVRKIWLKDIAKATEFGFAGNDAPAYYRELVNHEYCHSFVTNIIDSPAWRAAINETDSLFTPMLDSIMQEQAYGHWWDYVNEHMVRLCEVRLAIKMKDAPNQLRDIYVQENTFTLIPAFEKLMTEYEQNRDKYKTIRDYIPIMIAHLKTYDKAYIDKSIIAAGQ